MSSRPTTPPPHGLPVDPVDAAVELLERSGMRGHVRVRGTSMEPNLSDGQVVVVEFSVERRSFGDILMFRHDGMLVVHRLVGQARRRDGTCYLRARGDGRVYLDPPVAPGQVVGRVSAIEDGDVFRSTRELPARLYGRLVALHDLAWAGTAVLARRAEFGLSRLGLRVPLCRAAAALDRAGLRVAHRLLFRASHPRLSSPGAGPVGG